MLRLARHVQTTQLHKTVLLKGRLVAGRAPVVPSCRALSSSSDTGRPKGQKGQTIGDQQAWYQPWLSDKSLYPVIGITLVTVAFAVWFAPAWILATPSTRIDRERRQSVVYDKTDSEAIPMSSSMYKMSRKLTKEMIYPATLGSEAGTEDSMAKKAEQENVAKSQPAQHTTDK